MTDLTAQFRFPTVPIGRVAEITPSGVDKISRDDDTPVRLCNYMDVYNNDRIRSGMDFMKATATATEIERLSLRKGDVAVTKDSETPDDIGVPAVVAGDLNDVVLGYHLTLIRSDTKRLDPTFLYWALRSKPLRSSFEVTARGVTRFGLRTEDIAAASIPLPSLEEQRRIADYLDEETGTIDRLLGHNERVSALLDERWQALVDQACLGQLDRGQDWEGSAWPTPEHWDRVQLRYLAEDLFTDGDWVESPYITDEGVRLIQTGNIGLGSYREQGYRYISEESFEELHCTEVLAGDVLICRLADPVGRACLAPDLGTRMITAVDVAILRPRNRATARYLVYFLSSTPWLTYMDAIARGGTRDRISRSQLGETHVPVPPVEEQKAIANRLSEERERLDAIHDQLNAQRELLQERRQSLITAAVTGRLHVTTAEWAA